MIVRSIKEQIADHFGLTWREADYDDGPPPGHIRFYRGLEYVAAMDGNNLFVYDESMLYKFDVFADGHGFSDLKIHSRPNSRFRRLPPGLTFSIVMATIIAVSGLLFTVLYVSFK